MVVLRGGTHIDKDEEERSARAWDKRCKFNHHASTFHPCHSKADTQSSSVHSYAPDGQTISICHASPRQPHY